MSAPWIWILLPGGLGIVLLLVRPPTQRSAGVGAFLALTLAGLAWAVPIGEAVQVVGRLAFRLDPGWQVLGRQFVLENQARPWLVLIYGSAAFWLAGAYTARISAHAVGLTLIGAALGVGALAVRPFLYAVLLIALAAGGSLPLLVEPRFPNSRGAARWLALQALAVPPLLMAGWWLSNMVGGPADAQVTSRIALLLGIGFALLLSLFPFHSPLSLLSEETSPYALVWVVTMSAGVVGTLGLFFLARYPWLRTSATTYAWLEAVGVIMWVLGGLLVPFQRHAGRMLGYAALAEMGVMIAALSAGWPLGGRLFFVVWPVRTAGLVVWGAALSAIQARSGGLRHRDLLGLGRRFPVLALGVIGGALSLAGVPWSMGFPSRLLLWSHLAARSPWALAGALLGAGGIASGALRLVGVLWAGSTDQEETWGLHEPWGEVLFVGLGLILLWILGMFPGLWLSWAWQAMG